MGTFSVKARLPDGRETEVFVDTGSTFSKLPAPDLDALGVSRSFDIEVELGDGAIVRRSVGYVELEVQGRRRILPVAFGGAGELSLLGATALEIFGFAADASRQELIPTRSLEIWAQTSPPAILPSTSV